jgi:hypothetical protein
MGLKRNHTKTVGNYLKYNPKVRFQSVGSRIQAVRVCVASKSAWETGGIAKIPDYCALARLRRTGKRLREHDL